MKRTLLFSALLFASCAAAQTNNKALISRGHYLVTSVAKCGDCHTPFDQQGNPVKGKWLMGSELPFKPVAPMPWASAAPPIAGLPGWTDAEITKFLMTGVLNGQKPRPPMPEYRLTAADARAVTAYLRSLEPSKTGSLQTTSATK